MSTPDIWHAMILAPLNCTIDAYFEKGGENVLTRTRWLADEGRWNGMAKGEQPLGWRPLPVPPAKVA